MEERRNDSIEYSYIDSSRLFNSLILLTLLYGEDAQRLKNKANPKFDVGCGEEDERSSA